MPNESSGQGMHASCTLHELRGNYEAMCTECLSGLVAFLIEELERRKKG